MLGVGGRVVATKYFEARAFKNFFWAVPLFPGDLQYRPVLPNMVHPCSMYCRGFYRTRSLNICFNSGPVVRASGSRVDIHWLPSPGRDIKSFSKQ
jgi:hypothetical protein